MLRPGDINLKNNGLKVNFIIEHVCLSINVEYDLVLRLMKFIYSYSIVFVLKQKLKPVKPHVLNRC